MIKGGTFPLAYTYPSELRPTRDLLRRRRMLVRHRSEVLAHIKLTHYQYNAQFFEKNINKKGHRQHVAELFDDPAIIKNINVDLSVTDHLHDEIKSLENYIVRHVKKFDPRTAIDGNPFGGFDHVVHRLQILQSPFFEWIHRLHFITG